LASREQLVRSVFYFREPLPYKTFSTKKAAMFCDEYNTELSEADKKERKTALEKLKANIIQHFDEKKLENKVKIYSATWDEKREKLTGLKKWGDIVYADILDECEKHAKDTWDKVPQNWQEQELALLDAFIEQHTHITIQITDKGKKEIPTFCGRKELLKDLKKHLLADENTNWGLVLTGESGSGKSAVFSMVTKMMENENCFVLAHSAGLSPRAKSVADLLRSWNKQLANKLGIKDNVNDDAIKEDDFASRLMGEQGKETTTPIEKLQEKFRELLFTLAETQRVVILIDALDRFEPTARAQHLSWLPSVMPNNVRLLCTAITGTEQKALQYHKGLTTKNIDFFTTTEAKEMLAALCLRQHKALSPKIEKIILEKKRADGKPATTSPLWLSLAVNILMAMDHDDFEKMSQLKGRGDQQIESYMTSMALEFDPLPGTLFLNLIDKAGIVFGEEFTKSVFNYVATSRNGLREKDLEKILPSTNIVWDTLRYANLRRWFKAHLVLQGEELQWNLAHSVLKTATTQEIENALVLKIHDNIAGYLLPLQNDPLKATEIIYHLLQAKKLKAAAFYYGGELTEEEKTGANKVLAEIITADENGVIIAVSLLTLVTDQVDMFESILKRYILELDDYLSANYDLDTTRLMLLEELIPVWMKDIEQRQPFKDFDEKTAVVRKSSYYVGRLFGKLGDIRQKMGDLEIAFHCYVNYNELSKEVYHANPDNIALMENLSVSYQRLGIIHEKMGDNKLACEYYKEYYRLSKTLSEVSPQDQSLKRNFAVSCRSIGFYYYKLEKFEEAKKYLATCIFLANELLQKNPEDDIVRHILSGSSSALGLIYQAMDRMGEALNYFEMSYIIEQALYKANPKDMSFKKSLAEDCGRIGTIYLKMENSEEAMKYFDEGLRLLGETYKADLLDNTLKNGLALSYEILGDKHQSIGQLKEALKFFIKEVRLFKELFQADPSNESQKNCLALSCEKLARIHEEMGHTGKALIYYDEEVKFFRELYKANPSSESIKNQLAISYENLGCIHQSMNHMGEALKYFDEEVRLFKELYKANPCSESIKNGLAISYSKLGNIHSSMGDTEETIKCFDKFSILAKELYKVNPHYIGLLEELGISYYKLSMVYKTRGDFATGKKLFQKWKNIISFLVENVPQVNKYQDWDKLEYERRKNENKQSDGNMKNLQTTSLFDEGDTLFINRKYNDSLKIYQNSFKIIQQQLNQNPENKSWQRKLATIYNRLGNVYTEQELLQESEKAYIESLTINEFLTAEDPNDDNNQRELWIAYWCMVEICEKTGSAEITNWYQKVYNTLTYMKEHGLNMNAQDEEYLEIVKQKLFREE